MDRLSDYTRLVTSTYAATFYRPVDGAVIEVVEQRDRVVVVRDLSLAPKVRTLTLNVGVLETFWIRTY